MLRSLIQPSAPSAVQSKWGEWRRRRDEPSPRRTSSAASLTNGTNRQLPVGTVYGLAILLIAVANAVNTFSNARDISWRLGTPHNLWEPALWEITSGVVVMALLPIARRAAHLIRYADALIGLVVAVAERDAARGSVLVDAPQEVLRASAASQSSSQFMDFGSSSRSKNSLAAFTAAENGTT